MEQTRPTLIQKYRDSTSELLTSLTNGNSPYLWRELVLEMSAQHDFLYHAILGLSSLHADLQNPSEKASLLALEHHSISITQFRQALAKGMTADNSNAMFAFQCIAVAYSFGFYGQAASLAKLKDLLTILRGSKLIVKYGSTTLETGPFWPMIALKPGADEFALPPGAEEMIRCLESRMNSTISTATYRTVYESTIDLLRYALSFSNAPEYYQIVVNTFLLMVEDEFLNLVYLGEPLALAIMGNYAVALQVVGKNSILIRGWGVKVLEGVRQWLPKDWHDCIAWAEEEVFGAPER
ncbi:uncharacterized protein HMPREF1541_02179 [Cyphellophora europaea CBS 101466]|uniref:Uncharacterized protein n=1 Tax=Cyphellophora europaea (strain CBS 101466) TaxID=1220924 RepID=W2S2T0_CYPE1|nr:uncharacterized protein HMPREF1541_02179 [Cyphellophora europaea CBS 101466]ETN43021.1 hypothetical protein HMPREF1541_02179 [Cyphellophora europaea CBS 101466]